MTVQEIEDRFQELYQAVQDFVRAHAPNTAPNSSYTPHSAMQIPQSTPTASQILPPPDLLGKMCIAISDYEGGPGDLNYTNKNPGNLRHWPTQIGENKGFAVFSTWDTGMAALRQLITDAAKGLSSAYQPTMTIPQFFSVYSPSSDGNNPDHYAFFVMKRMGVDANFQIKELV